MPIETFKATCHKTTGLAVESEVRGFKFVMDEPKGLGGTNTGMNPVEALLCALGSCQCIVASAFAKSQGVDLQDFWVDLEGDLDPDGFLRAVPGVRNGFQQVRFTMHIKSDSPREKLEAFQRFIEKRCPVGDCLLNGVQLQPTALVVEEQA